MCRGFCGLARSRSCLCCSPLCSLATLFGLFLLFLAIMFIGQAIEQSHVESSADTAWVYDTHYVCAVSNTTFSSKDAAHAAGQLIRHCGACGACSTEHDVQLYYDTKDTLTEDTTSCAVLSITQGASGVTRCMDEKVNMTRGCTGCWVENVMCDLRQCVFSCLLYRMGMGGSTNTGDSEGSLSDCLNCDEKLCGPAFINCAGANRRRSGIESDIERNMTHVCRAADVGPGAGGEAR